LTQSGHSLDRWFLR